MAKNKKIKVGLIVDEFFGGAGTAYGGYGFLARNYVAKYLPNDDIQVDVLLGVQRGRFSHPFAKKTVVDGINVYRLPSSFWARKWFRKQNYDVYLSVEMTTDLLKFERNPAKRVIHWIQDPTTGRDWVEVSTVNMFIEGSYWDSDIYDLVHRLYRQGRVRFISQGYCLNEKAKELYRLRHDVPIEFVPNPVDIDHQFDLNAHPKKNMIVFLGRLESVKRGWLFCEIAKRMPEHEFYILGQTFRHQDENEKIFRPYKTGVPNLHFQGLVEGEEKKQFLKDAKILVNTSIREGIPISYLEALSFGTLIVSGFNAEGLPEKFGAYVGKVLGDGFDKVDLFVEAIRSIMLNEVKRIETAKRAIAYVKDNHTVEQFQTKLRGIIYEEQRELAPGSKNPS